MRGLWIVWAGLQVGCIAAGAGSSSSVPVTSGAAASAAAPRDSESARREPSAAQGEGTPQEFASTGMLGPEGPRECPLPEDAKLVVRAGAISSPNGWTMPLMKAPDGLWDLEPSLFWCSQLQNRKYEIEVPNDLPAWQLEMLLELFPAAPEQNAVFVIDGVRLPFRNGVEGWPPVGRWGRVVVGEKIQAFELSRSQGREPPSVVAQKVLAKQSAILPWIRAVCASGKSCVGMIVEGDAVPLSLFKEILALLNAKAGKQPPVLTVRTPTGDKRRSYKDRNELSAPLGRLPPATIQSIVRANFGVLRGCYEEGLARDPNLKGRVNVRFVIERDGRVVQSSADDSSDLPDRKVVECVAETFKSLVFPPPRGGIVTVVYPIMLSPG